MAGADDEKNAFVRPLLETLEVGEDPQVAVVPGGSEIGPRIVVGVSELEAVDQVGAVASEEALLCVHP